MDTTNVINLIIREASRLLPKGAKVILFVSRARGTAKEDSDWDILILLNKERRTVNDLNDYGFPFRQLGWDINQEINPIVSTFRDMASGKHSNPFYYNIANEGITIWG